VSQVLFRALVEGLECVHAKHMFNKGQLEPARITPALKAALNDIQAASNEALTQLLHRTGIYPHPALGPELVSSSVQENGWVENATGSPRTIARKQQAIWAAAASEGSSGVTPMGDNPCLIFSCENSCIITVQTLRRKPDNLQGAIANPQGAQKDLRFVRVITRDTTGKYAWDFAPFESECLRKPRKSLTEEKEKEEGSQVEEKIDSKTGGSTLVKINEDEPADLQYTQRVFSGTKKGRKDRNPENVLESSTPYSTLGRDVKIEPKADKTLLSDNHVELDALSKIFNRIDRFDGKGLLGRKPIPQSKSDRKNSELVLKELKRHDSQMKTLRKTTQSLYAQAPSLAFSPKSSPIEEVGPFDLCREFLSNLFVGIAAHEESSRKLGFITDDSKLRRSIKLLDRNHPPRDCHKIGVIYVAEGQNDQRQILRNFWVKDDLKYQMFLNGLGWEVEMISHPGFVGGLDRRGTTGRFSRYFSDATVEVMFHVVTLMPTKESDIQQIHKKRHVGNDHVQIVFCNDKREYRPKTITSQFNDAHVVIYPLDSGMYRIQIHKKEFMPGFGPLKDGMVVGPELLGPLVRQTALNASKARRSLQPHFVGPLKQRLTRIQDIIARYSNPMTKTDAAEYLTAFFRDGRGASRKKKSSLGTRKSSS